MAAKDVISFRFRAQYVRLSALKPSSLLEHSPPESQVTQALSFAPSSHFVGISVSRVSPIDLQPLRSLRAERKTRMQKAHLYEAILLVNRGIDEAVQGLERLKRAKYSGLDASCFDEKLTLFEIHRASLNSYLCNNVGRSEDLDLVRFEQKHHDFEKNTLDEVQVYRDLRAIEERRRIQGKPPRVRFFTQEEQREWERQYPKPSELAGDEVSRQSGGRP
jgi:hypothetical protein